MLRSVSNLFLKIFEYALAGIILLITEIAMPGKMLMYWDTDTAENYITFLFFFHF